MNRYGYKKGIHVGLSLYSLGAYRVIPTAESTHNSLGAIFFWPSAKFEKYGGFVGCTFVIGCGLSTLEVAANSYISVLGTPKFAAARLNFSQGFQGIASFAGPMIASRWFFLGKNATTLDTVQWYAVDLACIVMQALTMRKGVSCCCRLRNRPEYPLLVSKAAPGDPLTLSDGCLRLVFAIFLRSLRMRSQKKCMLLVSQAMTSLFGSSIDVYLDGQDYIEI